MKFKLKTLKPRNPFVVAALRRNAGSHRASAGACRQQAQRAMRREIEPVQKSP
jgi:hypothetical protein